MMSLKILNKTIVSIIFHLGTHNHHRGAVELTAATLNYFLGHGD